MKTKNIILFSAFVWALSSGRSYGQTDSLKRIQKQFDAYSQQTLQEKLYVHVDRPFYVSGEILWFKLNAVDGTYHKPLRLSTIAYVEVLDAEQKPVLQAKVSLQNAAGSGSFSLPASLASGNYVVRAYTSWMKNFSPDFYSYTPVTIVNTRRNLGLKAREDSAALDVQFFPEGGNLVSGLTSLVAFKVADKAGKGVAAEGTIVDAQGTVLTQFKTLKFGLGKFTLTPAQAGSGYTAVLRFANRPSIVQKLPAVQAQGYVLRVEEKGQGQLSVAVASNVADKGEEDLFLVGRAGQRISVLEAARLANGRAEFVVNKLGLADGITHFTVLNSRKQPLGERLYFQRPKQQLLVASATDKPQYSAREKVSLQLSAATAGGQLVPADMSLAVYRLDSLSMNAGADINSVLWLTSDLKGTVENPNYYFTSTGAEAAEAADNLMLTHGWSRFRWTDVFSNTLPPFDHLPELNGHLIEGSVVHRFTGKPTPKIGAYLASPSRVSRLYTATSDENGRVRFEAQNLYGLRELMVQTNPQTDSMYRVEILNPFSVHHRATVVPPLVLSEAARSDLSKRSLHVQVQNAYFRKQLSTYRMPAADSVSFYGKANETYKLDDYTRFKVLEEVMREYVPGVLVRRRNDGFHFLVVDNVNGGVFTKNPMVLLDGFPVFNINKLMAIDPLTIQKLEVFTSRYMQGAMTYEGLVNYTTYKGDLGGFQPDANVLVQEYEGLQWQREFYSPRYETAAEKQSRLPDARNLLYWNPSVATTVDGNKTIEFYTSDQPGKYVVVVQGIAPNGLAGSRRIVFELKQPL